jgi:hypothetical protein
MKKTYVDVCREVVKSNDDSEILHFTIRIDNEGIICFSEKNARFIFEKLGEFLNEKEAKHEL